MAYNSVSKQLYPLTAQSETPPLQKVNSNSVVHQKLFVLTRTLSYLATDCKCFEWISHGLGGVKLGHEGFVEFALNLGEAAEEYVLVFTRQRRLQHRVTASDETPLTTHIHTKETK